MALSRRSSSHSLRQGTKASQYDAMGSTEHTVFLAHSLRLHDVPAMPHRHTSQRT